MGSAPCLCQPILSSHSLLSSLLPRTHPFSPPTHLQLRALPSPQHPCAARPPACSCSSRWRSPSHPNRSSSSSSPPRRLPRHPPATPVGAGRWGRAGAPPPRMSRQQPCITLACMSGCRLPSQGTALQAAPTAPRGAWLPPPRRLRRALAALRRRPLRPPTAGAAVGWPARRAA